MRFSFKQSLIAGFAFLMMLSVQTAFADYEFEHNGTTYKIVEQAETWDNAVQAAKDAGGKLMEITDEKLQDVLYEAVFKSGEVDYKAAPYAEDDKGSYLWIGGNDKAKEGVWRWDGDGDGSGDDFWYGQGGIGSDDGYAVNDYYVNWGASGCKSKCGYCEPNDYNKDQDGCGWAIAGWAYGSGGNWNDLSTSNELWYVIEMGAPTLDAPTNLYASYNEANGVIDVTWEDNSDNEEGFILIRMGSDGSYDEYYIGSDETSFTDEDFTVGVTYTYFIYAYNYDIGIESDWSNDFDIYVIKPVAAPENLSAQKDNALLTVTLTWRDMSNEETGYRLYRAINGNPATLYKTLSANATSYLDIDILNGNTYTYTVQTEQSGRFSAMSKGVTTAFNLSMNIPIEFTGTLAFVGNQARITLSWKDNYSDERGFIIYKENSLREKSMIYVPANTTTYMDTDLLAGEIYTYEIAVYRTYIQGENTTPYDEYIISGRTNKVVLGITSIEIIGQTEEFIECAGSEDAAIHVAAVTNMGEIPNVQWYKDGMMLAGETADDLIFEDFNYTTSGVYACLMTFDDYSAGSKPMRIERWTTPIAVYALTEPEILEQPMEVIDAVIGENYSFTLKAHYRGIVPPLYKDNFEWYKMTRMPDATLHAILLKDDARFGGSNASVFTITNLADTDICGLGEYYFVKVVGQCGEVVSEPFIISTTPEVVFGKDPQDFETCPGEDVVLTAVATAPDGFEIHYTWFIGTTELMDDAKYNGTKTNKLQILDVQEVDEVKYTCVANIVGYYNPVSSKEAFLNITDVPKATAKTEANVTIVMNNDVTFTVDFQKGAEPITIEWTYKDEVIKEGKWDPYSGAAFLTILLENVDVYQSGEYICKISNDCDYTEVAFNLNVTKWGSTSAVNDDNSPYTLSEITPNPVSGSATISFEMPEAGNAEVAIFDANGKALATIFDGIANAGTTVISLNVNEYNLNSGVYFYTLKTNGYSTMKKMIITK